jgi:hypothetical protein
VKTPSDRPKVTDLQRRLIIAVATGAAVIAAIGFVGSYAAVAKLATAKGFGAFAHAFPIGIDAGILVLLALDLLLTWLRMPLAMLRHTAWLLTTATIAFNAAAAWPDPIGTGMHAVIPVLFVVVVDAARHAIGRTADITAGRHMDSVRMARWFLDPISTFRLWRRMKLWELRSYDQVIALEQSRLVERARLRARYGRRWRSKAPVSAVMALRLTRYGRDLAPVSGVLDIEHAPAGAPARALPTTEPLAIESGTFETAANQAIDVVQGLPPASTPEPSSKPRKPQPPSSPLGPLGKPVEDVGALFGHAHAPIVYFLRNGSRVKIGVSQNIRRRVAALSLRPDDVIRAEHGHQEWERMQHHRFADLRVDSTEWFELRGALAEYLGLADEDTVSGRPDTDADITPATSGQPDNGPDASSGQGEPTPDTEPVTSPDKHPDSPDALSAIASAASGPADLVKALATHGVPASALVSEAVRLRPDMVADSIRRTAKRLEGTGFYP